MARRRFTGGGGGDFGGGGATGDWGAPEPARRPRPKAPGGRSNALAGRIVPVPRPVRIAAPAKPAVPVPTHPKPPASPGNAAKPPAPWHHVLRNGYDYEIDDKGRTRHVSGALRDANAARSRTAQAKAGGVDRRASDEGGHYIARRFNGPRDAFNHFAQDRNFNRAAYQALENKWAKALKAGEKVRVNIEPHYAGSSTRPYEITVQFFADGRWKYARFVNEAHGGHHGKR